MAFIVGISPSQPSIRLKELIPAISKDCLLHNVLGGSQGVTFYGIHTIVAKISATLICLELIPIQTCEKKTERILYYK